ncbi:MAG: hypothetical protein WBV39_16750, partial [Rudaea sp.]
THVMVNRGTQPGGDALELFTDLGDGATWNGSVTLADSDENSTSDGYVDNDKLFVTYATPAREIVFSVLQYNAFTHGWSLVNSETAFSSPDVSAINPALAVDASGTLWLAFVGQDTTTRNYTIKLLRNSSAGQGWVDTGFAFGASDNVSIERSARPVATARGIGMIYTVHEKIYWAFRYNQWPLTRLWPSQLLYTSTSNDTDPYASHFSVVADSRQNIHMVTADGGRLRYFRMNALRGTWHSKWLTGNINAGYPQVTASGNNVVIAVNVNSQAGIYQSSDYGNTFTYTQALVHGAPGPGVSYSYPRIETPTNSLSPMPLLQQYSIDNGAQQRLLFYSVPVINLDAASVFDGRPQP